MLWIVLLSLFKGNEPWFWKVQSQSCQFLNILKSHCEKISISFKYRVILMRCPGQRKRNLHSVPTSTMGLLHDLGQITYPLWTAVPPAENWAWYYIFKALLDQWWKIARRYYYYYISLLTSITEYVFHNDSYHSMYISVMTTITARIFLGWQLAY